MEDGERTCSDGLTSVDVMFTIMLTSILTQ